jgi:hypothetical protein
MRGRGCLRVVWRRMLPLFLFAMLSVLFVGCTSPYIYSWGRYEDLLYASYSKPEKAAPKMQVERMEADYKKACARNKRPPPGFHAHLGHLYSQLGRLDDARKQFETEKTEFPESAVFIDQLIARLGKHETALSKFVPWAMFGLLLAGCATTPPPKPDYTYFRQFQPRSILVLPPLGGGSGTYSYLSTVTRPLAEMGYYVFPVALVDQFLKDNGMTTPYDMHLMPLPKIAELTGADAVLFLNLNQYGSHYVLDNFCTSVSVKGKLVDTRSGLTLWEGSGAAREDSSTESQYDPEQGVLANVLSAIFSDIFSAAYNNALYGRSDNAHDLCDEANRELFFNPGYGLLYGPYHPMCGTEPRTPKFEWLGLEQLR